MAELTPGDLNRIFFVNSGSEAIDTAMKVALAYHQARGQGGRTMFVSRERAYHGVNFGGVSLSGLVNNRRRFGPTLPGIAHMRHTHLPENRFTPGEGAHGADLAEDLQRFVNLYGAENIAACFVEPIAGSTGVLVPPKGYLKRLREICDQHGILLVFDEVITGFGRTGQAFAAQSFGVTPDVMTMAKALTNAAQPMGAVAVSERIHDAIFAAAPEDAIEFFHGYTYSGHPAACAAGLATLDIYRDEDLFERGRALSPYFLDAMFSLKDVRVVADIRGYGMLAAIELHVRRRSRQARPRVPEGPVRPRTEPQDDRRLGDRRAAADRRTGARRHDRGNSPRKAGPRLGTSKRASGRAPGCPCCAVGDRICARCALPSGVG